MNKPRFSTLLAGIAAAAIAAGVGLSRYNGQQSDAIRSRPQYRSKRSAKQRNKAWAKGK